MLPDSLYSKPPRDDDDNFTIKHSTDKEDVERNLDQKDRKDLIKDEDEGEIRRCNKYN